MARISKNAGSTNSQEAINRAQMANRAALKARTARDKRDFIFNSLEDWARIFNNSPISILTGLFVFSIAMEVSFSWPMYNDIMSQMLGSANLILSSIGALFIVMWGAFVSHLLSKELSSAMFNYSVYNEKKFSKNIIPQAAVGEKARISRRKDLIQGIVYGVLLLLAVAAISWQRVWLIGEFTGGDYSITHKVLPVVCVLIEIISGIYVAYLITRFKKMFMAKRLNREFEDEKYVCAYETHMAHEYYQHALNANEPIYYSKELSDSIYRFEHRTSGTNEYVNEIPALKTLKVITADEKGFIQGVHLAGVLSNGEYCNSVYTNQVGEGVLTWDSICKEVIVIYTNNEQHKGPFRENSTIRINMNGLKNINAN